MTLKLELSPEIEAKLRERAAAAGKDLEKFALEALQQTLGQANEPGANTSPEEWVQEWRTWAAGHRSLPFEVDDSRESIYVGRE